MKALTRIVRFALLFCLFNGGAKAQTNFLLTPAPGLRVSFPAQESYDYQIYSSLDFTNWFPASERRTSCGGTETFTVGITNQSHSFFRGTAYPPDLTRRLVGLTNIYFDNAVLDAQGSTLTLSNFRAESRDYNVNDYLKAQFQFDFCKQTLALSGLQVFTNLGLVCGRSPLFFIKDVTNQMTVLNGASVLLPDVAYSITTTGQTLYVNMQAAQVFAVRLSLPVTTTVTLSDPSGVVLQSSTIVAGSLWFFGNVPAFFAGQYRLQLLPVGGGSANVTATFHNANGHQIRTLTNGMHLVTSISAQPWDYDKFSVLLNTGQTLSLSSPPGYGAYFDVYNVRGTRVGGSGIGTNPLIFTATASGTYYVIYAQNDLLDHSNDSTVTISP